MRKPIVSVVAGAGYGKTQGVYAFAKKINVRTAWIQISQRDNLEGRFWENFTSAISIVSREAAEKLRQIEFPATEQQFQRLFEISRQDAIPNEKYLFVYDDIHLITSTTVLGFLERCLSALFPNITSVLISRTEPSLRMEKLEAKKLIARITGEDLRFSRDEMISYFRLRNVSPGPRLASAIYHDTEGWAFAIHLAALSLRNAPLRNASAGNLQSWMPHVPQLLRAGASRLIESEVMASVSPELRRLLIKLSLVENFDPDLVREIGKDPLLIKQMEGIDSFIRFDSFLNSYRIHHFFLDYLREKQDELTEEEKKDVWTKTALWCAANNRKMDAIISYDKAGDYGGIVSIFNTLPLMLPTAMARFIFDILERAPPEVYRDYPEIIVIRNRILNSLGRFEQNRTETIEIIPMLQAMPDSPRKHGILRACYINLGFIGLIQSIHTKQYDFTGYFMNAALESEHAGHIVKAPVNGIIMSSYACRVAAPATVEDMETYIEMIGRIVPYSTLAMGGCQAGMYELCRGEFEFYRGDIQKAETQLAQSLAKSRKAQQYEIANRALFYLLRINVFRADAKEFEHIFEQLRAELEEPLFLNRHFYHDIVTGWYYIQTGQKEKIAPWLKSGYEKSELNSMVQGLERLVKAKYYLSKKQYPAALAVMENRGDVEPIVMGDIEMKALEAVCRYGLQDREGAFKALYQAHQLAAPSGLFIPFAELGKDMRALAETAIKDISSGGTAAGLCPQWLEEIRRKAAVYAKKLYRQSERACQRSGRRKGSPLSPREMNVLSGLSQGLTMEEIAGAASISPNTVKSAVKSVYSKLGALNKADAIRAAAEKGIL
ncbi:MAG: LuxR C-terminal-related transcriptional regulator [Treponema sp.]|nr:LuxR C-terminal-related transcriptional regulator [Treponema sp.]